MTNNDLRVARLQVRVSLLVTAFSIVCAAGIYGLGRLLGWTSDHAWAASGPSLFIVGVSLGELARDAARLRGVKRFLS